jgi:hypothetical protein
MREDQIKILERRRDEITMRLQDKDRSAGALQPEHDALTDAISYIRDTSEMLEAARYALATLRSFDEKYFFDDSDYHLLSETAIDKLESALDAYRVNRDEAIEQTGRLIQPAPSHSPDQVCSGCCRCICHGVSWKPCSTCKPYHWQRELREREQKNA